MVGDLAFPRSVRRFSAFTDQAGANTPSTPAPYCNPSRVVLPAETMRRHGEAERCGAPSHPKISVYARLDVLALRYHRARSALSSLNEKVACGRPLLDLRVERAMNKSMKICWPSALKKSFEQPCRIRIAAPRCRSRQMISGDPSARHRRSRPAGPASFSSTKVVMLPSAMTARSPSSDSLGRAAVDCMHDLLLRELLEIGPAEIARDNKGRGQDRAAVAG